MPYASVSSETGEIKVTSDGIKITGGKSLNASDDGSGSGKHNGASFGADIVVQSLVPFTAWGEDWDAAVTSIKAVAGVNAVSSVFTAAGGAMLIAADPVLGALAAALTADPIMLATVIALESGPYLDDMKNAMRNRCKDNLKLSVELLKEGTATHDVSAVGLNPGSDIHPDYLTNIIQYIKTKYSLYSEFQPFTAKYHNIKVEEYSDAGCGFTFGISGGTGEFITDIQENQDIIILTAKSERMADYTINGETQLVRKISGEGSEPVKTALSGAALYSMRAGNRSMQKLQWEPSMNAPGMIQTNRRNSDILDSFETRFMYASETYPKKIRLVSAEGGVVAAQLLLGTEAFYRETTPGKILDMQPFKAGRDENIYAARNIDGAVWLDVLVDSIGRGEHIFLDSWRFNGNKDDYTGDAVLYDKAADRVYRYDEAVPADADYYIGYPYMSKIRTLPSAGFGDMRPVRLPRVKARLRDSCMPFINGFPEGDDLNPNIITDSEGRRSGIFNVPVPGTNNCDAAYEIYTNYPDSLSILAIYEEGV
jgi:hypothetical protein